MIPAPGAFTSLEKSPVRISGSGYERDQGVRRSFAIILESAHVEQLHRPVFREDFGIRTGPSTWKPY